MFARAAENDATVKAALEHAILYKIDCEKGEGIELAKRYGVRGYPTFKIVNPQGEVLHAWLGYDGPEAWKDMVELGVSDRRTLAEKKAAYAEEPTLELAKSLGHSVSTEYDFPAAVDYLRTARKLDPHPARAAEYTEDILMGLYYAVRMDQATFDDFDGEAKAVLAHPMAPLSARMNVAARAADLAKTQDVPERAVPYLERAMAMSVDVQDEEVQAIRASLAVDHALLVTGDKARAVELKKAAMDEGWRDNPTALNRFAWWCFENDVNLAEAEELALRGVELAETDAERANLLDTAAEICNARGDCEEAIARIKRAIALDPDKEYFQEQLARFEEELKNRQEG